MGLIRSVSNDYLGVVLPKKLHQNYTKDYTIVRTPPLCGAGCADICGSSKKVALYENAEPLYGRAEPLYENEEPLYDRAEALYKMLSFRNLQRNEINENLFFSFFRVFSFLRFFRYLIRAIV